MKPRKSSSPKRHKSMRRSLRKSPRRSSRKSHRRSSRKSARRVSRRRKSSLPNKRRIRKSRKISRRVSRRRKSSPKQRRVRKVGDRRKSVRRQIKNLSPPKSTIRSRSPGHDLAQNVYVRSRSPGHSLIRSWSPGHVIINQSPVNISNVLNIPNVLPPFSTHDDDNYKRPGYVDQLRTYLESKVERSGFRVGNLLGEGMSAVVFEGFDENNKKWAIKYLKKMPANDVEEYLLTMTGKLFQKVSHDIWIMNYCGISLHDIHKSGNKELIDTFTKPTSMNVEKAMRLGLHAIKEFHDLTGYVHLDIKPDNVCIVQSDDGSFRLELMDYGNALPVDPRNVTPFMYTEEVFSTKYKNLYKNMTFYDLLQMREIPISHIKRVSYGNSFQSLKMTFDKKGVRGVCGDDIEEYIITLWSMYFHLPWRKLKDEKDKFLSRLDPENCVIPLLKDILYEIRRNHSITVDELFILFPQLR